MDIVKIKEYELSDMRIYLAGVGMNIPKTIRDKSAPYKIYKKFNGIVFTEAEKYYFVEGVSVSAEKLFNLLTSEQKEQELFYLDDWK